MCGRGCWTATGRCGSGGTRRWCRIGGCAGSWPAWAHRSGSCRRRRPVRCCAATPTPGSPPPNAVGQGRPGGFPRRKRALMPLRWYAGTFTLTGAEAAVVGGGRPAPAGRPAGPARPLPGRPGAFGHLGGRRRPPGRRRDRRGPRPGPRPRPRPGSPGSTWASSTPTRWCPARTPCWSPVGPPGPSTTCIWPTAKPVPGPTPAGPPNPAGAAPGGGVRPAGRSEPPTPLIAAGSATASTTPPNWSSSWAVAHRVATLIVGDPKGITHRDFGPVHNRRLRTWDRTHLLGYLTDKAELAGIEVVLVDERGTSSTCPRCGRRVPKPKGRNFSCPHCGLTGHRDLVGAANIAAKGGGPTVTHR